MCKLGAKSFSFICSNIKEINTQKRNDEASRYGKISNNIEIAQRKEVRKSNTYITVVTETTIVKFIQGKSNFSITPI